MEKITNWTQYNENTSDWILKDWDKVLVPEHNYNILKKSFWQFPVSKNSCSVHWALTCIANTFNINYSLSEREEIWEEAKSKGASDDRWWYFADALKLCQEWTAENKEYKFRYYKIQKEEFEKYAKLWFTIYWGIKVKDWSTRDKLKDWVIWDDVESYWESKFWHAVCFSMIWDKFWFIDNYPNKTKYNTPTFTNLDKLLENWYFFNTWYILMTSELKNIEKALANRKEAQDKKKGD